MVLVDAIKSAGGMICLYPRQSDVDQLVVPGGEPPEDIHLTLVFLGDDVGDMPTADLAPALGQLADQFSTINARVFGHGLFNPDGHEERQPCAVYLVGDSIELADIQRQAVNLAERLFNPPEQHVPFTAHITAIYGGDPGILAFTGQVIFDRLGLALTGNTTFFPLNGA